MIGLTLSLVSQGGPAQAPPVAPDHSLSPQAYVQKGMPANDRFWLGDDYAQALLVLKSLAASDATQLPRYGSPASGPVFARIVSRDNLRLALTSALPEEQRLTAAAAIMQNLGQITVVYASATTSSQVFDSELVELMGYLLEVSREMLPLTEAVVASVPVDAPSREARVKGLDQVRQGTAGIASGCLTTLTDKKSYRVSELVRLAETMEKTLPLLMPFLPPGTQQELPILLRRMLEQESDPKLKQALQRVAAALDKSDKTPRVVRN
jgi:hypothetical protein